MGSARRIFTRRRVLGAGAVVIVAPPAGVLTAMKLEDNPLPQVAEPEPVLVENWLLETGDLESGQGA